MFLRFSIRATRSALRKCAPVQAARSSSALLSSSSLSAPSSASVSATSAWGSPAWFSSEAGSHSDFDPQPSTAGPDLTGAKARIAQDVQEHDVMLYMKVCASECVCVCVYVCVYECGCV
jgi:hypothetical protein